MFLCSKGIHPCVCVGMHIFLYRKQIFSDVCRKVLPKVVRGEWVHRDLHSYAYVALSK